VKNKILAVTLRGYPELLNVENIQEILHISRTTAYALLKSGELRSKKIRHNYRIPKTYLLEYLNETA